MQNRRRAARGSAQSAVRSSEIVEMRQRNPVAQVLSHALRTIAASFRAVRREPALRPPPPDARSLQFLNRFRDSLRTAEAEGGNTSRANALACVKNPSSDKNRRPGSSSGRSGGYARKA